MVTPVTYTAYDAEGKVVGGPTTGEDANNYIDPAKVQSAIQNVVSVVEQECRNIATAVEGIEPDLKEALVVNGKTMENSAEKVCSVVKSVPAQISSLINHLYNLAVQEHDKKQLENNEKALASVSASGGNVKASN